MPVSQSSQADFNPPPLGDVLVTQGIAQHSSLTDKSLVLNACKHLLAFVFPLTTFGFLLSGLLVGTAHSVLAVAAWTIPFWLVLLLDWRCPNEQSAPNTQHPQFFYDGILYALILLQLANVICMLEYLMLLRWDSGNQSIISLVNLVAVRFLIGTSSGTSGIVVAHELIHRPQQTWRLLGRLLLCTVGYEHFVISHKRGHHLNIGLPEDIATAKLGESFKTYWRRINAGSLRYAWRSEQNRLGAKPGYKKLLYNEVLQGLAFELILLALIIFHYGWLAAAMFLYQALAAVRILEAVNYFQHWGLENSQFGNTFGWVCRSWISRYTLIGLSHHIGHHEDENKQYHEIAFSGQGPILPYGYFVMNLWVKLNNASYQRMAVKELEKFQSSQLMQRLS